MLILMLLRSYLVSNVLNDVAALTFARGPAFLSSVFDRAQLDALVLFSFRLHNQICPGPNLLGLWLSLRYCCMRSALYRALSASYHHRGFRLRVQLSVSLFCPRPRRDGQLALILKLGIAFLWLLIWGAKPQPELHASHPQQRDFTDINSKQPYENKTRLQMDLLRPPRRRHRLFRVRLLDLEQ